MEPKGQKFKWVRRESQEPKFNWIGFSIFSVIVFIGFIWCVWWWYVTTYPDLPKPFPSYPNATKVNIKFSSLDEFGVECGSIFNATTVDVYTTTATVTEITNFYNNIANNLVDTNSPGFNSLLQHDVTCFYDTSGGRKKPTTLLIVFDPDNKNDPDLKADPLPLRSGERVIILVRGFTYFE